MKAQADVDTGCAIMNNRQAMTLRTGLFHELPPITGHAGRGLGSNHIPNGVTKRATTNGSAASPGSGFLTGTQPPKKQTTTVQRCQCSGCVSNPMGRGAPGRRFFKMSRSSSRRRIWARSRRISLLASNSSLACFSDLSEAQPLPICRGCE